MERKIKEVDRKEERKQKGMVTKRATKLTEYGRQLLEKQKLKETYGMRERQFKRFFAIARQSREATGEQLLSLLERRLDNVVFRLKLATTRNQARQVIVHGHVIVNNTKVHSPSYLVKINDEVSLSPASAKKEEFVKQVVDKRGAAAAKVPDWLEHNKKDRRGKVLRFPVRADVQIQVNENSIVELYSK
ncbi:TPA: 30S ribosomal protein S4 [Candidatus Dependentiae bacterium]|nr:MAG: 30S ribosomal protein S4 [candidate division TM6 bacterium GW2011_GWF2_43_87]HBL98440.1 30S ribosomal protein S4 [Candidatus Dependentiae bacterium]